MKYAFIKQHRGRFKVRRMCRALGVSHSGYYAFVRRPPSVRALRDQALLPRIKTSFIDSRHTYGARRVRLDLVEQGECIGRHTVGRLMRHLALEPKTVRRFRVTMDSRKTIAAPNRLAQQFEAQRPDQRWVSDITFIPTRAGWLYLSVFIDLYSRAVVGWSMNKRMTRRLVIDGLQMALAQRQPRNLELIHSDQRSQYTCAEYLALLEECSAKPSMSRKGCCWDNAVAESFFHTLKNELIHGEDYRTREQARSSIFEYIEPFYNRKRRHTAANGQSPMNYERNYQSNP
ncbi:IS3 family transposase [Salinisphaera sp.]|uniref:IS3 family transposase n=1 Tax=Salinisphaera sp. TaxID=1914330 RepID=UPI002D790C19|nr:IS3 family transposase [Salinisphaera sp.]HET7313252.1 IS3 family transposase [Salinisphaera sp.]